MKICQLLIKYKNMEQKNNFYDFAKLSFNIETDIDLQSAKRIHQKNLINTINCVNFKDGILLANFKHSLYGNLISVPVKPQPCFSNVLDCSWINFKLKRLTNYQFLNFFISDGYKLIFVKPELEKINEEGLTFILPEYGYDINRRNIKRYSCKNLEVEILQSGLAFYGQLIDFSGEAFCIRLKDISHYEFQYSKFNSKSLVVFKQNNQIIFSGECIVVRKEVNSSSAKVVFKPDFDCIQRFKQKEIRSLRLKFLPSPTIIFKHPIIDKLVTLKIEDLSGSGLSVEESYNESLLLPGMIIPNLEIEFTPGFKISCKAQVLYRKIINSDDENKVVKCGMAFIELDIKDQVKLSAFLHRSIDEKSYVCNRVDLEVLWDFFFETGFFYSEKYAFLHANKEKMKEVYEKLYFQCPNIARHFIYQDKGKILAHISMLRVYEQTWLIQHHASLKMKIRTIGQIILKQLGIHINDFRHIYSSYMKYLICIYRPDNKFPSRVFGGFANHLNKLEGCSTDSFGYFYYKKDLFDYDGSLNPLNLLGWKLNKCEQEDLLELENFYKNFSNGLLMKALELTPDKTENNLLKMEFEIVGFKYERKIFSLKKENELIAVFESTITDIGLNLSNFTNCIRVFILNPHVLDFRVLYFSLYLISKNYEQNEIPVMVFPLNYFEIQTIKFNKVYNIWVLDTIFGDEYLKFTENLLSHKNTFSRNRDDK